MRCLPILIAIGFLFRVLPATGDEEPYTAYAREDAVDIRSGPGDEFYITERLTRGSEITVYRENGDWLAIQPTEKSFSLVARSSLKPGSEPGVGEVIADQTEAWVGSHVAASRLLAQVRLDRGELVEVLGHREALLAPGGVKQRFYEIAPPAGEFRWVRTSDVSRDAPPSDEDWFFDVPDSAEHTKATPDSRPQERQFSEWKTKGSVRSDLSRLDSRPGRRLATDDLDLLHVQLSAMVARPVETWDLRDLRATVEHLAEVGPSAVERGRAQQLLERIESFDLIQERETQIASRLPRSSGRNRNRDAVVGTGLAAAGLPTTGRSVLDSIDAGSESDAGTDVSEEPAFDGRGWLMKLHSTGDAPPYVLKDDNDRVVQLITPSPGLNLNRYVKKRVGIIGRRGQVSQFDLPHVTAERIVELDRHRR